MIATNDSGPLRHRHGTPRDLLIGVHLATTDGRLVKAGGTVVKNVAGYDLGKLVSGSFGSLAAIVSATFKLAPLPGGVDDGGRRVSRSPTRWRRRSRPSARASSSRPRSTCTSIAGLRTRDDGRTPADGRHSGGSRHGRAPYRLLIQFASTPAAIDAQVDELRRLVAADSLRSVTGADGSRRLARPDARVSGTRRASIVRASWLPANLRAVLSLLERDRGGRWASRSQLAGRAGVGAGLIRIDGDAAAHARRDRALARAAGRRRARGRAARGSGREATGRRLGCAGRSRGACCGAVKRRSIRRAS